MPQREIKFKAFVKKYNEVDDVEIIDFVEEWVCMKEKRPNEESTDFDCVFALKDVELMQFTGLKDKNGKEIYEGDILEGNPKGYKNKDTKQVEWDGSCFSPFTGSCGCCGDQEWDIDTCEVVGNLYENPELLK